jgi:hypothetical protein
LRDADHEFGDFGPNAKRVHLGIVSGAVAQAPASLENARCAAHPEQAAAALCVRCGDYHCRACSKLVAGRPLCERCRNVPGVDYLEETRRRYWGKRDGFVWYFTLSSLLGIATGVPTLLQQGDVVRLATLAVWAGVTAAYAMLWRPARLGMIIVSALDLAGDALRVALGSAAWPAEPSARVSPASMNALALFGGVIALLLTIAAYRSPRNALAFEIAIDETGLQRVYDRFLSNPLATRAAIYGALSLLIPFTSAITLVMGIVALRRSAPDAVPPRTGRAPAIIGIGFSVLGLLIWTGLMVRAAVALLSKH